MATVRSQWTARPLGNFSENIPSLHVWTGYVLGALVVLRILWGFIGPEHARFGDFMFLPPVILGYLLDLARLRSKRYLGHSPAGAAMFFVPLRGMPPSLAPDSWSTNRATIGRDLPVLEQARQGLAQRQDP